MIKKVTPVILWLFVLVACKTVGDKPDPPDIDVAKDFFRPKVADSLKHLIPILDSVFYRDQLYRGKKNRKYFLANGDKVKAIDSLNLIIVDSIIKKYGILGLSDIGMYGHFAITMTIQHSDIETQRRYLPEFKKALELKRIFPNTYAMLEDRVLIKSGKKQIYGTQLMFIGKSNVAELLPIVSPDSIDIRRRALGLKLTIGEYLKSFNIKWNCEEYKKQLPSLMMKYKISD